MRTITISALAALLAGISRVTEIEVLTRTNARARKNPFGKILKESRVIGEVGVNYQKSVNRALMKSLKLPTFKAASRKWGVHVGGALIEHKGKNFVQMHVKRSLFPRFLTVETLRGAMVMRELTREKIQRFLPASYFSQRQADKGLKEPKQVVSVTYALNSIAELTLDGQRYVVAHE